MNSERDANDNTDARVLAVSGLPETVVAALSALAEPARKTCLTDASREQLGDLVQAAEVVKGFTDASLLESTPASVEDIAADHGIGRDDPR